MRCGDEGVLFISFFGPKFTIQEQIKWGLPRCSHRGVAVCTPSSGGRLFPCPGTPRLEALPQAGSVGPGPRKEGEQLSTSPGPLAALSAPAVPPDLSVSSLPPATVLFPLSSPLLSSPPSLSLCLPFPGLPSVCSFYRVLPELHMHQRWVGGEVTERILALPGAPGLALLLAVCLLKPSTQ